MKTNTLFPFCLLMFIICFGSSAQVGIGTTTPRGALEINSSTNGFVPPQIALTSTTSAAPVVNPQTAGIPIEGTIVYNTATAGTSPNNVTPGYYFWNGASWTKFAANTTSINTLDYLRIAIDKGSNPAQLGSLTGISGPEIWFFRDGFGVESMSFSVQLPYNWKEGTTIYPRIHWIPKSSTSGNISWNLDYTWANIDGTFSETSTSSVVVNGPFTANKHLLSNLTSGNLGIDATGKTVSNILICRLWRDSNNQTDTYAADAGGLSLDFKISTKLSTE